MKLSTLFKLIPFLLVSIVFNNVYAEEENFRTRVHIIEANTITEEDIEAEIKFGKTIAARILGQFPVYKNKELIRYVNLVGKSLALNSSRNDIDFLFTVLDTDLVNAYSAPGGYVFITRGAIEAMRNEAELAAVLAHEVAHITEKHIVKEFNIRGTEQSAAAGLSQLLGSASSSAKVAFSQAVDNAVNMLLEKGFKKEDELESDQVALLLLASTGYDPMSLRRYLERLKKQGSKNTSSKHKSTHPPTSSRIKALDKIAKNEGLQNLRLPLGTARFAKYAMQK